ncbi:hypothetical protein H6P81_002771 [Aristolochia fimbriata]|uniref:Aminotransferase-like plant mobile domain-containing protein n=1 Tax=Aristolochia fimbriata TaxID=158543 RepID=A0AAV7FBD7_ARIFI|nr:hypothetical protein H6P81_002771 [Aristolochia fimbriata]
MQAPHGYLRRPLTTGERVFFIPYPDSSCEDEDVAAGPETFALQSALHTVNQLPLHCTLADDFMDGGVVQNFHAPNTTLDTPLPFLFKWTTLLLGRCSRILRNAGVYYVLWASIFYYSYNASVVQAFIDAWCPETNALIACQGELSITFLDMDQIFGLPISRQFYNEVCPMVADFKDVQSSALPYSCQYLFLSYHRLYRCLESPTLSTTTRVSFWFRTNDNGVPVHDPWTAWHAAYEKGVATSRERTAIEQDVFDVLRVMPGKEDEVHLAALFSVWLSRFVFRVTGGNDLRPTVFKVESYMATRVRFALAGPSLTFLYRVSVQRGRLESTASVAARSSGEEEGYDTDRSHLCRRRLKGKQQVGASLPQEDWSRLATLVDNYSAQIDTMLDPPEEQPSLEAIDDSHVNQQKASLEDIFSKFQANQEKRDARTEARFQTQEASLKNQEASIRNLEIQVRQLATVISEHIEEYTMERAESCDF